jgi:hypothetical protein
MDPIKPMQPMQPMKPMAGHTDPWWSGDLGEPSSTGAQNDRRYAYFAAKHRLAVHDGGRVRVFDTGARRITGFAQSGGKGGLSFASDDGDVDLMALKEL